MGKWKELAQPLDDSDAPIAMPTDANLLQQALDVMLAAIKAGDWKVDGACDPDMVIYLIQHRLSQLNDIHTCHADCQNPMCIAVRQAVAEEREACAKLVEYYCGAWCDQGFSLTEMIRARGKS